MMELTCALVLLVQISFVISNPYGYGPRAGASAKAEASAAASPIDLQGSGYSGGFSKSYSSSSASSSASSGAISSAFSFSSSGSGASLGGSPCGSSECQHGVKGSTGSQGAYNGNNASPSQGATGHYSTDVNGSDEPKIGCVSGKCQPGSNSGSAGPTGSSNTYSSAKAIASSAAVAQGGSTYVKDNTKPGCEGSDCNVSNGNSDADTDDKEKCTSGSCGTTPQVKSSADYAKCASGQCGPNGQSGSPTNEYGSNDIKVSTSGASTAKSNYGSYGQTSTTNSGCKYGNCGGQPASNPSSYTPEYPPCSSSDCNNYGQGSSNTPSLAYNKPSILLTAPKECTTPNCQSAQTKPPNTNSYPTSNYGAPSQSSFTNPSTTPCIGGNCNFGSTKAPFLTSSVTNSLSSYKPSQTANVAPNYPTTHGYAGNKPSYGSSPSYSSLVPSGPEPQPGPLSPPGPASSCAGPPGTPCNDVIYFPEPKPGPLSHPGPASSCAPGPPGTPCNDAFVAPICAPGSPNCNVGPTTGYHGHNSAPKPGPLLPSGPASICAGPPGTTCNDAFVAPVCAPGSPNCNMEPTTSYHGYNSVPKPGPLSPPGPASSCAGPPGTPCNDAFVAPVCAPGSPNCNKGPTTGYHGYNSVPKPGPLSPPGPSSSCTGPPGTPCNDAFVAPVCAPGSPNCNKGPTTGYHGYNSAPKPGPLSPPGPSSSCTGPPGTPCNDAFVAPVCAPGSPNCNKGPATGYHGYNSVPKPGPLLPPGPSSSCAGPPGTPCNDAFVAPVCAPGSPNCNVGPTTGYQGYNPSTSFAIAQNSIATPSYNSPPGGAKPGDATESDKPYKGGFGGPSGILKPNEFKAPSVPFTPATSQIIPETSNPACGTGNCGKPSSPSYGAASGSLSAPGTGSTGFGGPAGILKPNEFTGPTSTYNKPASGSLETKPACSTGNCGQGASPSYSHASSGAQAGASASASANAVAYTGGFGGPPGVLKPYDGGKIDAASGKPQSGQYVSQQGKNSNNGLGSHQGSYSNNGIGSLQGAYSNNGVGAHQGSYSNNGAEANQGSFSNNGAGAYQGSYSNSGVGSHQGSYSNNGAVSQPTAASAGALSGSNSYNSGSYGNKGSGGCGGSGCRGTGSYGARSYSGSQSGSYGGNSGANFGSDGLSQTKTGEGWNEANAKSVAGAVSSGGYGGYASSSASAHATSGAAIKGSYGKR